MQKNKKIKVLITGGAGFIGYHLAKNLLKDCSVDLLDNLSRGKVDKDFKNLIKENNVRLLNIDLNNKIKINSKNYDYIFHLAATIGVDTVIKNPFRVLNNNYLSTLNVIKFAKEQKKLKKLFFTSTSEIYSGSFKHKLIKFPTKENSILSLNKMNSARGTYMLSKIYCEALCHFSNIPFIILRPHNIFGERMGMSHVIPELIKKIHKSKKNLKLNNSNHKRSFCYIEDAVSMMILLMKNSKAVNRTYNLGDPNNEISILNLAKKLIKFSKSNKKIIKINHENFSVQRRLPDIKKILEDTRFKKKSNFDINLRKTYDWYEKNLSI
jgi:UDP-glucose 4-epimerase